MPLSGRTFGSPCLAISMLLVCYCIHALSEDSLSVIQLPSVSTRQYDGSALPVYRSADRVGETEVEAKSTEYPVCQDSNEELSCPISCFRPDPVCGVDGTTYWCGCKDAKCAKVEVAHRGFCNVAHSAGPVGPGSVSGQALLLIHTVWLGLLGLSVLIGLL